MAITHTGITANGTLRVFDNFQTYNPITSDPITIYDTDATATGSVTWQTIDNNRFVEEAPKEEKFLFFFKRRKKKLLTPEEFFRKIKATESLDLEEFEKRVEAYNTMYQNARKHGQEALAEKIEEQTINIKKESILFAMGNIQILSEETVIKLLEKSERGIKIDWIKNFIRVIPNEVLKIKEEFDKLRIFDNYVVMHYDPEDDGSALTVKEEEEEEEKRRDPILFGIMKNARKFYFIADWKDEYCSLTLNEVARILGNRNITRGRKILEKEQLTEEIELEE